MTGDSHSIADDFAEPAPASAHLEGIWVGCKVSPESGTPVLSN